MTYKQLKTPNLDPVIYQGGKPLYNWLGWCLAYVQTAFGASWAGATAWDGWNRVQGKHMDRNIPSGVYVPIWFDGWWNGKRYGHVAIYKDGVVWSSPYSNKPYCDRLGSIGEVERIYGMTYVGWSEYVGATRVIERVNVVSVEQVRQLFRELLEREPDEKGLNYYTSHAFTYDYVRNDILHSPERNTLLAKKERERNAAEEAKAVAKIAEEKARIARQKEEEKKRRETLEREAKAEAEKARELMAAELAKKKAQAAALTPEDVAKLQAQQERMEALAKENNGLLKKLVEMLSGLIAKITGIFK